MEQKINKLRGRMGELDLNLTKLEALSGVTRKTLRLIMRGDRKPKPETVRKICCALKIEDKKIPFYFPHYVPEMSTTEEER